MPLRLSFFGGVREVTGSNFLLETSRARVLVDCGLRQGCHFCEGRNRRPFPYDVASVDAVVITHAHVDHIGLLPKLVRDGFSGPIFSTAPTRDFAELLLEDSARIIAEEASDRGEEALYAPEDVPSTIAHFVAVPYHERREIAPGVTLTFADAGHVLGSAIAMLDVDGKRLVFSGDLGNSPTPLLRDVEAVGEADYLLVESTYGDRIHEDRQRRREILRRTIIETIERRGTLLLPLFAFERTQEILAELNAFLEHGALPKVPVFVDSPLAIHATALYERYTDLFNEESRAAMRRGDAPFEFPGLRFTESVEESKSINDVPPPKIIIAGSGMMESGRILHHARRYLPDANSTVLIIGYQAAGSLGRRLLEGAREARIFGEPLAVRARVRAIGGYSAHADQAQLLSWLGKIRSPIRRVFITHGEQSASLALRQEIRERLDLPATVPIEGEEVLLD